MPSAGPKEDRLPQPRAIRSFVIRAGRITSAQQKAITELLPRYSFPITALLGANDRLFDVVRPLRLEIGIGNGENILAMADRDRTSNYVGSDVHHPGIGHALLGVERLGIENLRFHVGDAIELLLALPDNYLSAVYVYFPDPWPKKRHHKRRLLNPTTMLLIARCLRHGGRLHFATDNADYAESVLAQLDANLAWLNLAGIGCWAIRPQHRIVTRFEQRARHANQPIYELAFARTERLGAT